MASVTLGREGVGVGGSSVISSKTSGESDSGGPQAPEGTFLRVLQPPNDQELLAKRMFSPFEGEGGLRGPRVVGRLPPSKRGLEKGLRKGDWHSPVREG